MSTYSENAIKVFQKLYFAKDETRPEQVFERVARFVATAEHDHSRQVEWGKRFYELMESGVFRPNSPAMMNGGIIEKPQTSACFVGGMEDDLVSILDFDRDAALVFASGSGIGINFGVLRECEAPLSTGGNSSGPFAFMKKLAATGEAVKSGGRARRAAIMSMMFDNHPDLPEFITIKNGSDQTLRSMNLSVAASERFMNAVIADSKWELIGVIDGEVKRSFQAEEILDMIAENAHKAGDPGIWFIDRANLDNGLQGTYGRIRSTNPCGEQGLLPKQSCNLGSINLAKIVKDGKIDFAALAGVAKAATRFLDNLIDVSGYPTPDYEKVAKETRPIGLGLMGLADTLILMGIPYDSEEAFDMAEKIAITITQASISESIRLAEDRWAFKAYKDNKEGMDAVVSRFMCFDGEQFEMPETGIRNSSWTTIAPTGSISISADCSPGMEPLFAVCWDKTLSDTDETWTFVNPIFKERYSDESWYDEAIRRIIRNHGSCKGIEIIPEEVQRLFVVAHDIHWEDRIKMQAALQKGISNSISSTINLPKETTVDEIKEIYMTSWKSGLKGITIYRDGSLNSQPVNFGEKKSAPEAVESPVKASARLPMIRKGRTHQITTGHGKVYLTVNTDETGRVMEIFTNGGKNGSLNAGNMEAIARLISIAAQEGVPVDRLARTIENINDGSVAWAYLAEEDPRPVPITSVPDAIAKVLKRFYFESSTVLNHTGESGQRCETCNSPLYFKEGCLFCPECGSKCS